MNGNWCGTVYRDKAHREYIDTKEKELGREFTFEELFAADQEWYKLNNTPLSGSNKES